MSKRLNDLFHAHPHAVGETYGEHLMAASGYAMRMFAAGGAALVHAILPFLFEKTASNLVRAMYADMTRRGATSTIAPKDEAQMGGAAAAE